MKQKGPVLLPGMIQPSGSGSSLINMAVEIVEAREAAEADEINEGA
jgi:hypothetical protein